MQQSILIAVLAVMVYAVSLELRVDDFRYVAKHPQAVGIGLVAQFILLPLATLGATLALDLSAGGRRLVQTARGCVATISNRQVVYENGSISAARPGRWVDSA